MDELEPSVRFTLCDSTNVVQFTARGQGLYRSDEGESHDSLDIDGEGGQLIFFGIVEQELILRDHGKLSFPTAASNVSRGNLHPTFQTI